MACRFGIADLDTRPIVRDIVGRLSRYGEVVQLDCSDRDKLARELKDIDIVLIRLYKVDEPFLSGSARLKAIIKAGVGYDHIDVKTASRLGIHVSISVGNHISVAESAASLMLALCRNLIYLNRNTNPDMTKLGVELYGKNLGLFGAGRIGMHVAQIASGMGMRVSICDPYLTPERLAGTPYTLVDSETLIHDSDVLSLHCPLTDETRHIIGEKELKAMKRAAFLINTARGAIVDEHALCAALQNGVIAGAGLDVVENEPLREDNPLLRLKDVNLIVTPHRLIQTTESVQRQTQDLVESAIAYSKGVVPDSCVNKKDITSSRITG